MENFKLTQISDNIYNFLITDIPVYPSGTKIFFENLSSLEKIKILSASCSYNNEYLFALPEEKEIQGTLEIDTKLLNNYSYLTILANIQTREQDKYVLKDIKKTTISSASLINEEIKLYLENNIINWGEDISLSVVSNPSEKIWIEINNKEFKIKTNEKGEAKLNINSKILIDNSLSYHNLRIFYSNKPNNKKSDSGLVINIIPINVFQPATINTELPSLINPTLTDIEEFNYPSKGVGSGCDGAVTGCTSVTNIPVITGNLSSSSSASNSFSRINSFSIAKLSDNGAIIALSAQDKDLLTSENDISLDEQLQRTIANRVWLIWTDLDESYASTTRNAFVIDNNSSINECSSGVLKVIVDEDICIDSNLNLVWILDGILGQREFKIVKQEAPNIWYLLVNDNLDFTIANGSCFRYVAYSKNCNLSYPINLTSLNPLPYIQKDTEYLSAFNPQICSNKFSAPSEDKYIYIITEALVDGAIQLFFYGANISNLETYGWEQLTYDGENKNPKIALDKEFNLHIVWESSRCKPGQLMYGIIGPSSRGIANEVFISAVDKQAFLLSQLEKENENLNKDKTNIKNKLTTSLLSIEDPVGLDLRAIDAYGTTYGNMWTAYNTSGGTVSVPDDGQMTLSGNPTDDKFAAFACLERDEFNNYFSNKWDQINYQISFDLFVNIGAVFYTKNEINDFYQTFKNNFSPYILSGNINIYTDIYNNRFSLSEKIYSFEKIIPIAGSYKATGVCGNSSLGLSSQLEQLQLRPCVLAIVPEVARFLASNIETSEEFSARTGTSDYVSYVEEERYTGKFKLALIYESSSNQEQKSLREQKYQILSVFENEFDLTASHNYKLVFNTNKLRTENLNQKIKDLYESVNDSAIEDNYKYISNIIVLVDDEVQFAQNINVNYNDNYEQFDIGLGCAILGEYKPINIKPYDLNYLIDESVVLEYSSITIGPHSVTNNDYLTHLAPFDRQSDKMLVNSYETIENTLTGAEETFLTSSLYKVSLGLSRGKVHLNQIPITFEGKNVAPSIHLDQFGKVYISWQSDRDNNWEIYYTSSQNSQMPFRFDERITNFESKSLSPSISTDYLGRKLITWHDDRNGNFSIFGATSTKTFNLDNSICTRNYLEYAYGIDVIDNYFTATSDEYGEYGDIYVPGYASFCSIKFKVKNISDHNVTLHFMLRLYSDENLSSLAKYFDSRYNIANWYINGEQLPSNGWTITPGESVEVEYWITSEDQLSEEIYWCRASTDNNDVLESLDTPFVFYCPIQQKETCIVNCGYLNDHSARNVHFKVYFYRDANYSDLVFYANSKTDQRRFISRKNKFATNGISVTANEMVSAIYNPEIVSLEDSQKRAIVGNVTSDIDLFLYPNTSVASSGSTLAVGISPSTNRAGATNKPGYEYPATPPSLPYVGAILGSFTVGLTSVQIDTISSITVYVYVNIAVSTFSITLSDNVGTISTNTFTPASVGWNTLTVNNPVLTQTQVDNLKIAVGIITGGPTAKVSAIYARIQGSVTQNASNLESLNCGSNYWVKVETIDNSDDEILHTELSEITCKCSETDNYLWRKNYIDNQWNCSGNGGMDLLISKNDNHSLFSSTSPSDDGLIYISWENKEKNNDNKSINWTVWDINNDILYSKAQGYFDKIIDGNYQKQINLVSNLQNINNVFQNSSSIFKQTCSLWRETSTSANNNLLDKESYLLNSSVLEYISSDLTDCIGIDVYKDDITDTFYTNNNEFIRQVSNCFINFEINVPEGAIAIRVKNPDADWSEWLSIDKALYNVLGYSSSSSIYTSLKPYYIGNNKVILPWVLTAGNGTKTLQFEIQTYWGKTLPISYSLIARYKPIEYSIEFFRDNDRTIKASNYKNLPVISTKLLEIKESELNSIEENTEDNKNIYISVIFNDAIAINKLLNFANTTEITYNVILPAKTLYNLPLTLIANPELDINYTNSSSSNNISYFNKLIYHGNFEIEKEDGFYWQDGQGIIEINLPSPCQLIENPAEKESERKTVDDLFAQISEEIDNLTVSLAKFKENYNKDLMCSFTTVSCYDGDLNKNDTFNDETAGPPDGSGTLNCDIISWNTELKGEPCFYVKESENASYWVEESPTFEMDFSDSRIIYLKFDTDTNFEDILFLIKPNEHITYTTSNACLTTDPTGSYSRSVTYSVPSNSVVILHDYEQDVKYYCAKGSECNWASAQKIFNINSVAIATIPQGNNSNNGTDGNTVWSVPNAVGINVLSTSSSSSGSSGVLKTTKSISVSKDELTNRGFVTSGGIFRFKFAYVRSGKGFANIKVTCGLNC